MVQQTKEPKPAKSEKPAKEKQPKPEKMPLIDFTDHADATILDADGRLTVDNPEAHGFDPKKHERLQREDFATEVNWLTYKARDLRSRAARMIKQAERMERDAAAGEKFADPKKRAQLKKLQRLAASFKELSGILKGEGIDVDAMIADADKASQATS